ncbi:MAG: elongation factor P [Dehalococcoidia bacterium]|nr:elongation factor P [Dehalococcoidia bacterium]MDH4299173.1 elongation factor P [Dehalococcoidia bacterium]
MIDAGELRKGAVIELDGDIYQILEYQHVKMQQRQPVVKLKLRGVRNGNFIERNFQSGDKVSTVFLEHRPVQYLYNDGHLYYFMDNETYEQIVLNPAQIGDDRKFLKDGLVLEIQTCKGNTVAVELPASVELRVSETEPGFKGDRATAGTKPAKLETGVTIQVPLFINTGDIVKINTRTGVYLEKVS